MTTVADRCTTRQAEVEYERLMKAGYSSTEARAMVYEEDEEPIGLVGITLVDLAEYDAAH